MLGRHVEIAATWAKAVRVEVLYGPVQVSLGALGLLEPDDTGTAPIVASPVTPLRGRPPFEPHLRLASLFA